MNSVQMKWICKSERLPEKEYAEHKQKYPHCPFEVICAIAGAKLATVLQYEAGEFFEEAEDGEIILYPVEKWMPMPEVEE